MDAIVKQVEDVRVTHLLPLDTKSSVFDLNSMCHIGKNGLIWCVECMHKQCDGSPQFKHIKWFLVHVQLEHQAFFSTLTTEIQNDFPKLTVSWSYDGSDNEPVKLAIGDWNTPEWCTYPNTDVTVAGAADFCSALPAVRSPLSREEFCTKYLHLLLGRRNEADFPNGLYNCSWLCPADSMETVEDFRNHFWRYHMKEFRSMDDVLIILNLPSAMGLIDFFDGKHNFTPSEPSEVKEGSVDEEVDWEMAVGVNVPVREQADVRKSSISVVEKRPLEKSAKAREPKIEELLEQLKSQVYRVKSHGGPSQLFNCELEYPLFETPIEGIGWEEGNVLDQLLKEVPGLKNKLSNVEYEMLKVLIWEHAERRRREYARDLDPLAELGLAMVLHQNEWQLPQKARNMELIEQGERAALNGPVLAFVASFQSNRSKRSPNYKRYEKMFNDRYGCPWKFVRTHQRNAKLIKIIEWRASLYRILGKENLLNSDFQYHFKLLMELCDHSDQVKIDNLFKQKYIVGEFQLMRELYEKAAKVEIGQSDK